MTDQPKEMVVMQSDGDHDGKTFSLRHLQIAMKPDANDEKPIVVNVVEACEPRAGED